VRQRELFPHHKIFWYAVLSSALAKPEMLKQRSLTIFGGSALTTWKSLQ
jgi:hypothetical protein